MNNIEDELVELIDLESRFGKESLTNLENIKNTYSPKNIKDVSYNPNSGLLSYTFLGKTYNESLYNLLSEFNDAVYVGFNVTEFSYDETNGKMHVTFATENWPTNSGFYQFHKLLMYKMVSENELRDFYSYEQMLVANEIRQKANAEVLEKYKIKENPPKQPGSEE